MSAFFNRIRQNKSILYNYLCSSPPTPLSCIPFYGYGVRVVRFFSTHPPPFTLRARGGVTPRAHNVKKRWRKRFPISFSDEIHPTESAINRRRHGIECICILPYTRITIIPQTATVVNEKAHYFLDQSLDGTTPIEFGKYPYYIIPYFAQQVNPRFPRVFQEYNQQLSRSHST